MPHGEKNLFQADHIDRFRMVLDIIGLAQESMRPGEPEYKKIMESQLANIKEYVSQQGAEMHTTMFHLAAISLVAGASKDSVIQAWCLREVQESELLDANEKKAYLNTVKQTYQLLRAVDEHPDQYETKNHFMAMISSAHEYYQRVESVGGDKNVWYAATASFLAGASRSNEVQRMVFGYFKAEMTHHR